MKRELEKSLKRYLKRKVRITLGFVTAFAIMGNVGLAVETEDYIKAEEALKGLGTVELSASETITKDGGQKVTITNEDGNSLKLNFEGFALNNNITKEAVLEKNLISSSVGEYLKLAIENMKNGVVTTSSPVPAINDGIIDTDGAYERQQADIMINNGLSITMYGQWIENSRIGYNYGIMNGHISNSTQTIANADGARAYNYGIIIGNVQVNGKNSLAENYGLMLGRQNVINGEMNKLTNYGVITSQSKSTQLIEDKYQDGIINNNEAINYGILKFDSLSEKEGAQLISGAFNNSTKKIL